MGGPTLEVRAASWLRTRRDSLLVLAAYLALALAVTWPWITDPGDVLYGIVGGDLTSSVAPYQQLAENLQPPFFPGTVRDLNAPEGLETSWTLALAGVGSSAALFGLSLPFGSVAAHGLVTVLGFALSAFSMFLLVRWITGRAGAAFLAGLAFGFWPFTHETGWTWPHYTHTWVFVLVVWRMLVATERPTLRNGVFAGGAAVFAMAWIQYHLLIGSVLFMTLMLAALARGTRTKNLRAHLRGQAVAAAMVAVFTLSIASLAASTDYRGVPVRPASDAVSSSARPLMYIVPGPRHAVLGDSLGDWVADKYTTPQRGGAGTADYASIYLGIPLLLVALAGAGVTLTRVQRLRARALEERASAAGITALAVILVGLLFSAPPEVQVLGVTVPMPYTVVNELSTAFRVAHRFAVLVMLGSCVLAGIAVGRMLERSAPSVGIALVIVLGVVFTVDLSSPPSPRTTRLTHPALYDLLQRQPPGIVAEYPLPGPELAQNLSSLYQDVHEHPTFAGWDNGTESASRKTELTHLLAKRTVPDLAAYGVRYVLVRADGERPRSLPGAGDRIPGLRLIGHDGAGALYRMVATPATTSSYAINGFNSPEGEPPGVVRWLAENGGRIELRSDCSPCVGTVSFSSGTFGRSRTLTIRNPSGRVLYRELVAGPEHYVRFKVRFSRRTELVFSTAPPPDQINSLIGGADTRHFGVYVGQPVRFARRTGTDP